MTIEKQINADFMLAFKSRNFEVKTLLGTVKGEMDNLKKTLKVQELSNENSIELLNKFAKSLRETIKLTNDIKSKNELAIIEEYLPKQMTEDEIRIKLDEVIASGAKTIGDIMKVFATLPADKKIVSELVKQKL
jgi:uncharacterized protein YqeY